MTRWCRLCLAAVPMPGLVRTGLLPEELVVKAGCG